MACAAGSAWTPRVSGIAANDPENAGHRSALPGMSSPSDIICPAIAPGTRARRRF
jgi:hypothetical protein